MMCWVCGLPCELFEVEHSKQYCMELMEEVDRVLEIAREERATKLPQLSYWKPFHLRSKWHYLYVMLQTIGHIQHRHSTGEPPGDLMVNLYGYLKNFKFLPLELKLLEEYLDDCRRILKENDTRSWYSSTAVKRAFMCLELGVLRLDSKVVKSFRDIYERLSYKLRPFESITTHDDEEEDD